MALDKESGEDDSLFASWCDTDNNFGSIYPEPQIESIEQNPTQQTPYITYTVEERSKLWKAAFPTYIQDGSKRQSLPDAMSIRSLSTSPEPKYENKKGFKKANTKKERQSKTESSHKELRVKSESPSDLIKTTKKRPTIRKTSHNVIEARYRAKINHKLGALRDCVPSYNSPPRNWRSKDEHGLDCDGYVDEGCGDFLPLKADKSSIISEATDYIIYLKKQSIQMGDEMKALMVRVDRIETAQ